MNFKVQLPQNAGNRISEVLDFKISRGRIPPDPPTSARFSASVNKTTGSAPGSKDSAKFQIEKDTASVWGHKVENAESH